MTAIKCLQHNNQFTRLVLSKKWNKKEYHLETPAKIENETYRSQITSQPTFISQLIAQERPINR